MEDPLVNPKPPTDDSEESCATTAPDGTSDTYRTVVAPEARPLAKPVTGVGAAFGRYRIVKELGRGAMGVVYQAHDTHLDRKLALKIPFFYDGDGPEVIDRFYREARAMATMNYPHLCSVFDVGEIDGVHYLTMAFIEGRTLADYLRNVKQISPRQIAAVIRKMALALHEAHRANIVHRDLKPSNTMINTRGEPVIMDFGLARRDREIEKDLTHTGAVMGTPAYMAPEQVKGDHRRIGPQTDVYALGVILYEMICGRRPFEGPTTGVVMSRILTESPTPPHEVRDTVDRKLEAVCLKAMANQIEDRYQSAAELAEELTDYLRETLIPQTPPEADTQLRPPPVVNDVTDLRAGIWDEPEPMVPTQGPVANVKPYVFRATPPRSRPVLSKIPAVFLMVVGGIGVITNLLSLVVSLLALGTEPAATTGLASPDGSIDFFTTAVTMIMLFMFGIVTNGLVLFGGYQMFRLTSYSMAIAASILAMVPCSFGFLVGLPVGIWSLVILSKAEVKSSFKWPGGDRSFAGELRRGRSIVR